MSIGNTLLQTSLLTLLSATVALGQSLSAPASIIHHELKIELIPASHEVLAQDQVDVELSNQTTSVAFSLAASLQVESISLRTSSAGESPSEPTFVRFSAERLSQSSEQRINVALPSSQKGRITLIWTYRGTIDDPPKEPRHLRFVTPSETAGHIGPEGVYLSSETQWYPDVEGSLSSFTVTGKVPQDWTIVTQGKKSREVEQDGSKISTWVVNDRSEALTLVANKFVMKSREWKGRNGQTIELATYFFPDNVELADEYLEATAKYLDVYVPLLGDFPFGKFAVVENFFASGLGMPSFTLLGSGSIKRHYVQPYALGHEIVHSWIGNSVFNRVDRGNWVEGLTTYLANYYWHEIMHDARQAREQRRLMIQAYSVYVTPEQDYPVGQFVRKSDEKDNAIGYQKAAMVFHLLRHEIGEESFWRGLKTFVHLFTNRLADWGDLEQVFSSESHRDLRWFFQQWVERDGAPVLTLGEVTASRATQDSGEEIWRLTVRVQQSRRPYRLKVPIEIAMKDETETRWIPLSGSEETVELVFPKQPLRVKLDPELIVFRRFDRDQLPPMLNVWVTDAHRTVVEAFSDSASPFRHVVARMRDEAQRSNGRTTTVTDATGTISPSGSLLVLAGSERYTAAQSLVNESCGGRVKFEPNGFQIDGQMYEGPTLAVLVSCPRANVPGSVMTVLYGITPQAVAKVARLLFYYGWHSYVVFHEGAVAKRELWETTLDVKEVQVHAY